MPSNHLKNSLSTTQNDKMHSNSGSVIFLKAEIARVWCPTDELPAPNNNNLQTYKEFRKFFHF